MKTDFLKTLLLMLLVSALAVCAVSCGTESGEGTDTELTQENTTGEPAEPLSFDFSDNNVSIPIIYPLDANEEFVKACHSLARSLKNITGKTFEVTPDYYIGGRQYDPDKPEILVGLTNRPESETAAAGLRTRDYTAGISGKKFVIAAQTVSAVNGATGALISVLTRNRSADENSKSVFYETDSISFIYSGYRLTSLKIGGKDVAGGYVGFSPDGLYSAERYARIFGQWMTEKGGYGLPVYSTKRAPESDTAIVFESLPAGGTEKHDFEISVNGGKLILKASCVHGFEDAYTYVTGTLLKGDVSLEEGFTYSGKGTVFDDYYDVRDGEYRIIFNNILGNCDTSTYPTDTRNMMISELHVEALPDVVCLQECSANSRTGRSYIRAMKEAGFDEVTAEMPSGYTVNYTPVLYRKDVLELVDSGYLPYSDGAGDKSKSASWGVFKTKNGELFAVVSTHFAYKSDTSGQAARLKDAEQISGLAKSIVAKHSCPVIIGGDLNCNISSDPYKILKDSGFTDIYDVAKKATNTRTHHSYPEFNTILGIYDGMTPPSGAYSAAIDHALVMQGDGLEFARFEVVTDDYALLSTDHCPIIVDFNIKAK